MDMKVYKKTRYENIYKHKNGNYVVVVNSPVKSSISRIGKEKIWSIEDAKKIRNDPKTALKKRSEIQYKDTFDELWYKYIAWCSNIKKMVYNTTHKKEKIYNKYFKNKINKKVSKIDEDYIFYFVDKMDTTNKQKNEILKQLRAFFNWCVREKIILFSPMIRIKDYKVAKEEMKFWREEDVKKFFKYMNSIPEDEVSLRIKTFTILCFSLGDRVGETRALTFESVRGDSIVINHSINYDRKSNDFLASTKNYQSQRTLPVSQYVIDSVNYFKDYLINLGYNITDETLIFLNHRTQRPIDDVSLRKEFYNFCKEAGVPKIRLYDLRHTFASTMLLEGYELYVVSKMMGHQSIKTTADIYAHLDRNVRKEINKTTDKYILE